MSLSMVAVYLDVARNTVMRWISDGCPVEKEPEGKGSSYELDLAVVSRWLQSQAEAKATEKSIEALGLPPVPGGSHDGLETKEQADTRRARSMANISEIEEAEALGAVVPITAVETMITADYSKLRAGLEGIGSRLADRTAAITDPAQVKKTADEMVREALEHLIPRLPGDPAFEDDDETLAAA